MSPYPGMPTDGKELGGERIGFITKPDLAEFGIPDDKVAVCLPHA